MMNRQEYMAHLGKYRTAQKKYPANLYAHIRAHIVRMYRECEKDEKCAAEKLGCSVKTVRKYLNFVPFEHLMRDPAQAKDFDWRSLNAVQWNRLLWKYPVFFSRLPKNRLILPQAYAKILMKYPEAIQSIDLDVYNQIGCMSIFTLLLPSHPEFESYCDFSQFEAYEAKELLCKAPRYFDRIRIDTLRPYHGIA